MNDISETKPAEALRAEPSKPVVSEHPVAHFLRFIYDMLKTVVIVLIIAVVIRYLLVQPFIVDGSSMEPTFHNHEYLLVEKVSTAFHEPARGDIIVFKYPLNPSVNYVKRVIGEPGDKVVIANNTVTVYNNNYPNGVKLQESYIPSGTETNLNGDVTSHTWTVDQNTYFVLGDNRAHSDDSRSWGLVPKSNVVGRVWLTIYPFNNFGIVQHATY